MRRVFVVIVVAAGLVGCGTTRYQALDEARPVRPAPAVPPAGEPAQAVRAAAAPTDGRAALLNRQLLSHVSSPEAEADLPIGPGDLIEVSVFDIPELVSLKRRVPMRGTITLPLVGPISAAGRSAIELEDEIRARLKARYLQDPQVSVFVHEHRSQRISIVGAVRRGGVYTLTSRFRVADALALAEGLADDADHVIYVIRRVPAGTVAKLQEGQGAGSPSVPPLSGASATEEVMAAIDLEALARGQTELNVELQAGDIIHVARAGSYYVGGSVERSGSYFLRGKTTLSQAIFVAGGVKDVAERSDVRLYRAKPDGDVEVLTFDLDVFEQGKPAPEVRRNDVIIVGKSGAKAFWYGFIDFFKGIFGVSKGL